MIGLAIAIIFIFVALFFVMLLIVNDTAEDGSKMVVVLFIAIIVISETIFFYNKYLTYSCEKNLPRNQECKIIAIPKSIPEVDTQQTP